MCVIDALKGLTLTSSGISRIITSYVPTTVPGATVCTISTGKIGLSAPLPVGPAGASFNVTSVWNPPQTEIACFPRNDNCDNGPSDVTVRCDDGERAISPGLGYSCAAGVPGCAAEVSDTSYKKLCQTCAWIHPKECKPVQCSPHPQGTNEEATSPVLFGEVLEVHCKVGYRASTIPFTDAQRGVPNTLPASYDLICGLFEGDGTTPPNPANDRVMRITTARQTCEIVSCGLFKLPANATIYVPPPRELACSNGNSSNGANSSARRVFTGGLDEGEVPLNAGQRSNRRNGGNDSNCTEPEPEPLVNASVPVIHQDRAFKVSCKRGFRVSSSVSNYTHACADSFTIVCYDGGFMYGHGDDAPTMHGIPQCVPITCGIPVNDTCGAEHCHPLGDYDSNGNVSAVSPEFVQTGEEQTVTCNQGYLRPCQRLLLISSPLPARSVFSPLQHPPPTHRSCPIRPPPLLPRLLPSRAIPYT